MRAILSICAVGMLAGCSSPYDPRVDPAGIDPAKYDADLSRCRSLAAGGASGSGGEPSVGDPAVNSLPSAPIGPLYIGEGGAGSNLAPSGGDQHRLIDLCLKQRGYKLLQ